MRTRANRVERFKARAKAYVDALKTLEKDGFNAVKLWGIWVSYVANNYVKAGPRKDADAWAGPSSDVAKPLAYLATEPEMLNHLFPDRAERLGFQRGLGDVLKRHDFWRKQDYRPSLAPRAC